MKVQVSLGLCLHAVQEGFQFEQVQPCDGGQPTLLEMQKKLAWNWTGIGIRIYLEARWLKAENLDALQQIFLHLLKKGVGDILSTLTSGPSNEEKSVPWI